MKESLERMCLLEVVCIENVLTSVPRPMHLEDGIRRGAGGGLPTHCWRLIRGHWRFPGRGCLACASLVLQLRCAPL
eukprot:9036401-Prorocentrum_lima.AAC.1